MGKLRLRVKHTLTLQELAEEAEERLAEEAKRFNEAAEREPLGSTARQLLLRRGRLAEMEAHMIDWLRWFAAAQAKPKIGGA